MAVIQSGEIHKHACPPGVNGIHQFDELLQGRSLGVELGQGWINGGKAQGRIRASEPAHAGIGGRRGMDGKQLDDPASQVANDKIQFPDQVAKCPRRGDDRVPGVVQAFHGLVDNVHGPIFVRAKLTHEGIVDDIGTAGVCRRHIDRSVGPRRPQRVDAVRLQEITLGLEVPHFGQCDGEGVAAFSGGGHGNIIPTPAQGIFLVVHLPDDFPANGPAVPQAGPQPGLPVP